MSYKDSFYHLKFKSENGLKLQATYFPFGLTYSLVANCKLQTEDRRLKTKNQKPKTYKSLILPPIF
jgi:hypothetical protein